MNIYVCVCMCVCIPVQVYHDVDGFTAPLQYVVQVRMLGVADIYISMCLRVCLCVYVYSCKYIS